MTQISQLSQLLSLSYGSSNSRKGPHDNEDFALQCLDTLVRCNTDRHTMYALPHKSVTGMTVQSSNLRLGNHSCLSSVLGTSHVHLTTACLQNFMDRPGLRTVCLWSECAHSFAMSSISQFGQYVSVSNTWTHMAYRTTPVYLFSV